MPITGISFAPSSDLILTVSGDQSFEVIKVHKEKSWLMSVVWLFLFLVVLFVIFKIMFHDTFDEDIDRILTKVTSIVNNLD